MSYERKEENNTKEKGERQTRSIYKDWCGIAIIPFHLFLPTIGIERERNSATYKIIR
jgi:hypothetical protein